MITITKTYEIDAAHTLLNHYGPCKHMHGHRYKFDLTLTGNMTAQEERGVTLDGMLVDFSYLKQAFEATIQKWDHAYLSPLSQQQLNVNMALTPLSVLKALGLDDSSRVIAFGVNPTAENIAIVANGFIMQWLKDHCPVIDDLYSLTIQVFETPTSSATYIDYFWGEDHE